MVALTTDAVGYENEIESWSDDERMERFTHRGRCAYPVQSHASRIRGIVRSRATAGARRKAHAIAGFKRRRRTSKHWDWAR